MSDEGLCSVQCCFGCRQWWVEKWGISEKMEVLDYFWRIKIQIMYSQLGWPYNVSWGPADCGMLANIFRGNKAQGPIWVTGICPESFYQCCTSWGPWWLCGEGTTRMQQTKLRYTRSKVTFTLASLPSYSSKPLKPPYKERPYSWKPGRPNRGWRRSALAQSPSSTSNPRVYNWFPIPSLGEASYLCFTQPTPKLAPSRPFNKQN